MRFDRTLLLNVPPLAGFSIGGVCGARDGFVTSRKKDLVYNVLKTFGGAAYGAGIGFMLGFVWPITIPVAVIRFIDGTPIEGESRRRN